MASLINIFMSMELFLKETEALIKSADLFVYTKVKVPSALFYPLLIGLKKHYIKWAAASWIYLLHLNLLMKLNTEVFMTITFSCT